MSVGMNIKKLRQDNDLLQSELAKMLNVKQSTVSSWEKDRTEPSIGILNQICSIFHCDLSELIKKDDISFALNIERNSQNERLKIYYEKMSKLSPEKLNQALDYIDFLFEKEN